LFKEIIIINKDQIFKKIFTKLDYIKLFFEIYASPCTIDGYRDALFEKLHLKTRVGLVMYAIKNGVVQV
jgi:hypothetical protein